MKPLFVANWKMNKLLPEAQEFASTFAELLKSGDHQGSEIWIAPTLTSLHLLNTELDIPVGGQNVHWEESGAHTGEHSPAMLKDAGASFAIVGHSERRQFYGETDEAVAKRTLAGLKADLNVIICVGESEDEFKAEQTKAVVEQQLLAGLSQVSEDLLDKLVVAYEPVWAIGTGLAATPEIAADVHDYIRELLTSKYGSAADSIPLLYGGSTKPENISELCSQKNINGALVGGCSLKPDMFYQLALNGLAASN